MQIKKEQLRVWNTAECSVEELVQVDTKPALLLCQSSLAGKRFLSSVYRWVTLCSLASLSPPAPPAADSQRYCSSPGKGEPQTKTQAHEYVKAGHRGTPRYLSRLARTDPSCWAGSFITFKRGACVTLMRRENMRLEGRGQLFVCVWFPPRWSAALSWLVPPGPC